MSVGKHEQPHKNLLLEKAIDLLQSGDDTDCDGLVVVGLDEFLTLRNLVKELTGVEYGNISQDESLEENEGPDVDKGRDDAFNGHYPMPTFDVTLKDYHGDTDEADHLVKWVKAPSQAVLDKFLTDNDLYKYIESVTYLEGRDEQITRAECDLWLDEDGKPSNDSWKSWAGEVRKAREQ